MARFDLNDYVAVQERIVRFWAEYPDGRIDTQLMTNPMELDEVVFCTTVYKHREDSTPSATGWAQERAGGSGANQTSWVENCETSSIGRALANMGYATSQKDRPSREEMTKAQPPAEPERITESQLRRIVDHAKHHNIWPAARNHAHATYQVSELSELTQEQGRELYRWISREAKRREAESEQLPVKDQSLDPELNPEGI